jgi:hypothetical protein
MPKGQYARWTYEPRIAALEAQVTELQQVIKSMQESFNRGNMPPAKPYESLFKVWPGAHPNSNGS